MFQYYVSTFVGAVDHHSVKRVVEAVGGRSSNLEDLPRACAVPFDDRVAHENFGELVGCRLEVLQHRHLLLRPEHSVGRHEFVLRHVVLQRVDGERFDAHAVVSAVVGDVAFRERGDGLRVHDDVVVAVARLGVLAHVAHHGNAKLRIQREKRQQQRLPLPSPNSEGGVVGHGRVHFQKTGLRLVPRLLHGRVASRAHHGAHGAPCFVQSVDGFVHDDGKVGGLHCEMFNLVFGVRTNDLTRRKKK